MGFPVKEYISSSNYRLLKQNHPMILEELASIVSGPVGNVVTSPSGKPNLELNRDDTRVLVHPEPDPEAEVFQFLSKVPENYSGVEIFIGMGLCYAAKAVLEQRPQIRNLLLIEEEPGIFLQALKYTDLTEVLSHPKVTIGLRPKDMEMLMKPARKGAFLEDSQILEHPVIFDFFKKNYSDLKKRVFEYVNELNIAGATRVRFGKKMVENRFIHLKTMGHHYQFERLINAFEGVPAYIAAGGPSLDENIGLLKQVEGKALILSVDTAVPAFLKNDIRPDFVSCIDYKHLIYEKMAHVINDICDQTALLSYTFTLPDVQQNFPGNRKFYLFTDNGIDSWINFMVGGKKFFSSGPSVAHLNFIAAKAMGCSPIIFLGQDLCYKTDQSHSKSAVLSHVESFKKGLKTGEDILRVTGVDGTKVITNRGYENMKHAFEKLIAHNPGEYINCSTGGVHIEGTTYMPLKEVISLYHGSSINVSGFLRQLCSAKNRMNQDSIAENLEKDLHVVEGIVILVKKSDRMMDQVKSKLLEVQNKWRKNSALPPHIIAKLTEIDKLNHKIDSNSKVWNIVEDMTTSGLRKSEQMMFEIRQLEGDHQRYPQKLGKDIQRLKYINSVRFEALTVLRTGIEDVLNHISKEKMLLDQDINYQETIYGLAELYMEGGEYNLAKPWVKKFYSMAPDSGRSHFFMGCLLGMQNDFKQMESFFSTSIEKDISQNKDIKAFRKKMGRRYFKSASQFRDRDSRIARKFLLKGVNVDPTNSSLLGMLSELADEEIEQLMDLDRQGELIERQERVDAWFRDLTAYPVIAKCLSAKQLGNLYFGAGKIEFMRTNKEKATECFEKSKIYLPDDGALRIRMADLFLCAYDYESGLAYLNQAIDLNPDHAGYWEKYGDFLVQNGMYLESISAYDQASIYYPDHEILSEKISQSFLNQGNKLHQEGCYKEAIAAYDQGLDCCKKSNLKVPLYNNKGSALKNLGDLDSALAAYDKAIEINPHYSEALYNKGELYQTIGQYDAALENYQACVKSNPGFILAYRNLGGVLSLLGRKKESEDCLRKAATLSSGVTE
ncbi:6-hydroxymethylpterin diphosphokinase MptE-like protein [Desulfobacter latus]|uniref:DUF115 domain-containing protein n=1 Tax=Desulfobacter latus TaxID=2292 RepID=A0A850SXS3_9BACT|nr:6-hydroxymethylpterin diphosphokinase MptE-like protein [Desulfobacter latus]NWH04950.1 DUF115 domain-containing protein [Desulfobacter latus]